MADYSYGVVDSDVLKSYDGLGFLKAIIAGTVPQPPIAQTLGFHLIEAEQGRAVFEGLPNLQHYNPIGSVHGGFAATLLDSALGCAIFSTLHRGDAWTTLELKLNYVRAMNHETGPVRAEGRIIHRGRTVATSEGDLKDGTGKLYAHATTTCMIFPAKS
ncbi:MAG: PaaI family thioesterase [Pseudolabrys sp.]|nr:PaaI family thioesterase [Pseudolabrys sp.]